MKWTNKQSEEHSGAIKSQKYLKRFETKSSETVSRNL